uniref:Uncharacterized protein n=1 Tax=Arundo donax TaxID=35708 RepID=A0A0A9ARZ5_ARUDO
MVDMLYIFFPVLCQKLPRQM